MAEDGSRKDRRGFIVDMAKLALFVVATPAAAQAIAEDDKRLDIKANAVWMGAEGRLLRGYIAIPKNGKRKKIAPIILIHDDRGLQPYVREMARWLALTGFVVIAPDFLAANGGTPADEAKARAMIGALDMTKLVADGAATVEHFTHPATLNGKVGMVGLGWGGALAERIAVAAGPTLTAAVAFGGDMPAPTEAAKVKAATMLHVAGAANAGVAPWAEALKAAGTEIVEHEYPGSGSALPDGEAMALAWGRTTAFLKEKLT